MRTAITILLLASAAQAFEYRPAGELQSGTEGRADQRVYVPEMRFPMETAPAYPNSQVYGRGGMHGGGGGQCDAQNYAYPWYDNFCEPRRWDMPLCPGGTGHQGQDIRPSSCADKQHWTVAAEAGQITSIGRYSLYLTTDSGRTHRYLHMAPETIRVREGQRVARGARLGQVSNAFFDANGNRVGTTIHLHYDIMMPVASIGRTVFVPPYMSLVTSYEVLLGQPAARCEPIGPAGATLDEQGPCARRWGNERYWRFVEGDGVGGSYLWTNGFANDTPANWARWSLEFSQSGRFAVEVNVVSPHNRSTRVPYKVRFAGQERRIVVSHAGVEGWLRLGEFNFARGGDQNVEVYDNTGDEAGDQHITFDALRLVPIEEARPDAGPPPPPEDAGAAPEPDAGAEAAVDAGTVVQDAGPVNPDAGAVPAADTGDDGRGDPPPPPGCGCTSGPDLGFGLLLLAAGLRRRRD